MLKISNKFFGENKLEESMDIANDSSEKKQEIQDVNVDLGAKMETVDNKVVNEEHSSVLIDNVADQECEKKKEAMNEANNVSIDVTKALLLLGINAWSNLEPGKLDCNSCMLLDFSTCDQYNRISNMNCEKIYRFVNHFSE